MTESSFILYMRMRTETNDTNKDSGLKIREKEWMPMKLKDGLILREVAGQFVVVPTGKRVQEVTSIVYISSSGAYLWDYMKDHEFQKEDLVKKILEHYTGVTGEQAAVDIEKFLKTLADNNILDDGKIRGQAFVKMPKGTGKDGV